MSVGRGDEETSPCGGVELKLNDDDKLRERGPGLRGPGRPLLPVPIRSARGGGGFAVAVPPATGLRP